MRLLLTGAGEPGFNMALDEALGVAVRRGWSPPTLRIFQWQHPAISLGCHQRPDVLQLFEITRGTLVVQRPTAGGAVLHGRDVSYALVLGTVLQDVQNRPYRPCRSLYRQFHEALGRELGAQRGHRRYRVSDTGTVSDTDLSAAVCFQQPVRDDLMRGTTKVAGAAQRRWRDGLLQQGTVVEPSLSTDRVALCIRTAWAFVLKCSFTVGALTVQERLLADELWRKYRPWMPSSWPPVSPHVSNR